MQRSKFCRTVMFPSHLDSYPRYNDGTEAFDGGCSLVLSLAYEECIPVVVLYLFVVVVVIIIIIIIITTGSHLLVQGRHKGSSEELVGSVICVGQSCTSRKHPRHDQSSIRSFSRWAMKEKGLGKVPKTR
jgi:hypothetical protein